MPKRKQIKIGSPAFNRLQSTWYKKDAKLAASRGEKDVERYQDFNKLPITTMPRLHGSFIYDPESDEISDEAEFIPLADTDKGAFWREVGRCANNLLRNDPMYKIAHAFAEHGSFMAAGRAVGLPRKPAEAKLKGWLRDNGLKEYTGLSRGTHDKGPPPGPVRVLSKVEIAKLDLTPPRSK